jgi:hypothetical protein
MKYSTEYTAVIALLVSPLLGSYLSDACAGEVSGVVASFAVSGASALFLFVKRYNRGGVTPLGVKE